MDNYLFGAIKGSTSSFMSAKWPNFKSNKQDDKSLNYMSSNGEYTKKTSKVGISTLSLSLFGNLMIENQNIAKQL